MPRTLFHRVVADGVDVFYRAAGPNATVEFLETGRFALETHLEEITAAMRQFLAETAG